MQGGRRGGKRRKEEEEGREEATLGEGMGKTKIRKCMAGYFQSRAQEGCHLKMQYKDPRGALGPADEGHMTVL